MDTSVQTAVRGHISAACVYRAVAGVLDAAIGAARGHAGTGRGGCAGHRPQELPPPPHFLPPLLRWCILRLQISAANSSCALAG